jgi:AcrR family transcriptional regulator
MKDYISNPKRIIDTSQQLFFKYGYSRVSVDEIASELCMSKKTIYQHFKGKKEILVEIINNLKNSMNADIEEVLNDNSLDFTEKLQKNLAIIGLHLASLDKQFLDDMRKSVPEAWTIWEEYRRNSANQHFRLLLDEGIRGGYINPAISPDMAVIVYLGAISSVFDPLFINQLPKDLADKLPSSPMQSFNQIIKIVYEGILSAESKQQFKV